LLGFLAQALSGISGGVFHGFSLEMTGATRQQIWNLTLLGIGATLGFLASAVHAADVERENGKWIAAGVAIGVAGLGIQMSGWRLHEAFNHNDIFHVIQIAAIYLFFKGARRLQDRAAG
jgi:hypothetical protein